MHAALRQHTLPSSAITMPRGVSAYLTKDLQRWADVYQLMLRALTLSSFFRLLSSGTTEETQARAFDILQSLALLATAPAQSMADCGPALQEWTRLLLFDLLHTLAQVCGRGICHDPGHCRLCFSLITRALSKVLVGAAVCVSCAV